MGRRNTDQRERKKQNLSGNNAPLLQILEEREFLEVNNLLIFLTFLCSRCHVYPISSKEGGVGRGRAFGGLFNENRTETMQAG